MDDPFATPGAPPPASLRAPAGDPFSDPFAADDPFADKPSLRKRLGAYLTRQQTQANPAWMRYLDPAYLLDQAGKGAETAADAAVEKIRPVSEAFDKTVQDMQAPDRGLPSRVAGAVLSSVPSADQPLAPVPRIPQVPGQSYLNPLIYPAAVWNDVAVPLSEMTTGRNLAIVGAFSPAAAAEAIPGLAGLSAKALRVAAEAKFGSDMSEATWESIKQAWQTLQKPDLTPQEALEATGKPVAPGMMAAGLVGHVASEVMPPGGATPAPIPAKTAAQARIQARAGGVEADLEAAPEPVKVAPAAPVLIDRTIDEFKPGDKFTAGKTEYTVGSSDPDGTVTVVGSDGVEVQLPKGTKLKVAGPQVQETPYSPEVKPTPTVAGGPTTKVEATPAPEGSTSTAGSTLKPEAQVGREKVQDAAAAPPATPPIAEGSRVAVESPTDRAKNAAEPVKPGVNPEIEALRAEQNARKLEEAKGFVANPDVGYQYMVAKYARPDGTPSAVVTLEAVNSKTGEHLGSTSPEAIQAAGGKVSQLPDWIPASEPGKPYTQSQIDQLLKEGPPNATGIKSPSPEILRNTQPAAPGPQVAGRVPGVDQVAAGARPASEVPAGVQPGPGAEGVKPTIEATPEKAVQAVKSPDLPDRPALVAELDKAGHAGEEVVKGLEAGDPKALVAEADRGNGSAGRMQSAYFQARRLGLISDTANRAFRTQLLVQNPDLFRLIDGAEKSQGIGIVAVPSVLDPPAMLKKLTAAAEIAWTAAKEALFNTTGGVSRQVFELFHQMRGRNAAALDTVFNLAKDISRSFGGSITDEQSTAAAAYLDPRFLNRFSSDGAKAVRAVMDQLTDAQKASLDAARDFITRGSETMTELGITKEGLSEVIRNNYGRYVSRSYKIFSRDQGPAYLRALRTPGTPEYQTRYLPTIKALAADGDVEQSKLFVDRLLDTIAQKNDLPRRVIDNLVRDEVKRLGSNITLNRTLREDAIRNLFGEITDPVQQMAHTILKQQELINTWVFRKRLADNLGEQGLVRTIDPDQITRDYADHQKEIVDEEVAKAIKAETMRRADTDQPMTPALAKAIEGKVRADNPLFSQRVRTRAQELMFQAKTGGRTPDFSAAMLKAEREVYSEHQEQALEWYRDSGQMEPGESLFALDPAYRAGMQIDSSRNINDPFANLVVTKEARPYLMEYTKMLSKGMNLFQEATQLVNTGATVLAPMTVARNLFTSLQPIISAGNALRLAEGYGRDAAVMAQTICNHLIFGQHLDPKLEPLLNELFEQGVIARGALSGDTANLITAGRDVYKRTSKLMREVKETGHPSLEPITSRLPGMRPEEVVTKIAWGNEARLSPLLPYEAIARHAQDLYRGGDDFPKIINYLIEKQKANEAYPDDPALALSEAQRKFRATNYDYARIIPIVRLARQVPLAGLFTSFVSESYRVVANSFGMGLQDMAQGMKTGNAALLRQGSERLIGTSIAVGGLAAYCETSRTAAGLSYEDEKTLRKLLPSWSNNSHLYWYSAADGHVKYLNFGKNEMFSAVSQPASALLSRLMHGEVLNDPSATLGKEAWTQVQEVLKPFVSPQIFSQALLDVVAGHSATGKPIFAPDDGPGDRAVKAIQYIAAHALNPGVARSAWASIEGMAGATNRFGQPLKAEQPILNLAGLGDIDMKQSFMFYALRGQRDMQTIESEFRTMSQDLSTGVTLDKVYAKLQDVEERRKAYYLDIQRAALVALKTGVSQEDLFTILRQQGFQRRDIGTFLENGKYLPFIPAKSTFLRAEQIGRPMDPDKVLSIVGQYMP